MFLRKRGIYGGKFSRVLLAVIRRDLNPRKNDHRTTLIRCTDHRVEVLLHQINGISTETVITAKFDNYYVGLMYVHRSVETAHTITRGVAAYTGIDNFIAVPFLPELGFEQRNPGVCEIQPETGAQTIADHQHGLLLGIHSQGRRGEDGAY